MLNYILSLLLLLAPTQLLGGVFIGFGSSTPAGVWYYGVGSDNYANTTPYDNTTESGDDITLGAGTMKKLAAKLGSTAPTELKIAAWDSSFNLLVSCTVTSPVADSWNECSVTDVTVTNSQVILVAALGNVSYTIKYNGTSSGHYKPGQTYSSWPPSTRAIQNDYEHAVRVYVE